MPDLDTVSTIDAIGELYAKYADDLHVVREEQRRLLHSPPADRLSGRRGTAFGSPVMKAQLDDLEAELTYLRLRERRPDLVVEIGCLHGWSTTWLLRALRDNGRGHLHSYDLLDHARRHVPPELAAGRWTFHHQDVRQGLASPPNEIDYLFLDAAHSGRFARWYLTRLIPGLRPGTPVSVHDVFHHRWPLPFTEGAVLLRWLRQNGIDHLTVAPARDRRAYRELLSIRDKHGLTTPVHKGRDNPMLFFTTLTPPE